VAEFVCGDYDPSCGCCPEEVTADAVMTIESDCDNVGPFNLPRVFPTGQFETTGIIFNGASYTIQVTCNSGNQPVVWAVNMVSGVNSGTNFDMNQDGLTLRGQILLQFPGIPLIDCILNITVVLPATCYTPC
jgi:hypothetical protein